jgi:hypothetical protein
VGGETRANQAGGIAGHNRIGGHVAADHGIGADHSAITDGDAGEDDGMVADPDIAADMHVALAGGVAFDGLRFGPEGAEGVGGSPVAFALAGQVHAVFAAQENADTIGQRAVIADDQGAAFVPAQHARLAVAAAANGVLRVALADVEGARQQAAADRLGNPVEQIAHA